MANTLTDLIPDVYRALEVVSRERIGFIPAVTLLPGADRVAKDETVRIPAAPAKSATDVTPGPNLPSVSGDTFTNKTVTLSNFKKVPFVWEGEEAQGVANGPGILTLQQQQIAQAFRTLSNAIEEDLGQLYSSASRAYGTAGTTPFGTAEDLSDIAQIEKILADNGAPEGDLHLVLNSSAVANIKGKQKSLFKANEAGTDDLLRRGSIGDIEGFMIHRSKKVQSHTAGTGASYLLNGALAVGDETATVDGGTGTILAGDVVTIAGSTDKYVVDSALSGNDFGLAAPGAQFAHADNAAVTLSAAYAANMAFARSAMVLGARPPKLPPSTDKAVDRIIITDPISGLSFDLAMYAGYYQTIYEISLVWGVSCIKPEHTVLLLG